MKPHYVMSALFKPYQSCTETHSLIVYLYKQKVYKLLSYKQAKKEKLEGCNMVKSHKFSKRSIYFTLVMQIEITLLHTLCFVKMAGYN